MFPSSTGRCVRAAFIRPCWSADNPCQRTQRAAIHSGRGAQWGEGANRADRWSSCAAQIALLAILELVHRVIDAEDMIGHPVEQRSEEHTSELQSLMRISYAVFCL